MSEYIACTTLTQVVFEYYCYVYKIVNGQSGGLASLILSMMYQSLQFDIFSSPFANRTTYNALLDSLAHTGYNWKSGSRDFPITKEEQENLRNVVDALPLVTSEFVTPELREICRKIKTKFFWMIYNYRTFQSILDEMPEKCRVIDEVTKKFDGLVHSFHDIMKENVVEKKNYERQNCGVKEIRDEINRLSQQANFTNSFGKARFINSGTANRPNTSGGETNINKVEHVVEKPTSLEANNVAEKPTSSEAENVDSVTSLSTMQITSVVADINSSHTLAKQDSLIFGIHTIEKKFLG
ncbi:hypothetical protein M9H77_24039 [Catharanthus roseus]|uniref:Uncharacterized protein n=1 Tax=Catharanthus roseus TaxID=4058 RepID=A0ACC0AVZ9_CATRO|nr:hypothetical protein M9H77_24039 [Catharanthus roseus]